MIVASDFTNKKITVMGLGLHGGGLGAAKWLLRHGAKVTVTDLKDAGALKSPIAELEKEFAKCAAKGLPVSKPIYALGHHNEADFAAADMVLQNPAVPRDNPFLSLARSKGVKVDTDIGIFFRYCPFPITGITGTKGKSTVTVLLSEICRLHDRRTVVGGNIRISPLDSLDGLLKLAERGKPAPPVVLELSSWQLEGLAQHHLSPKVAVITNIMEDHLNRYDGMDDYAAAKRLIVDFQKAGDTAVLNAEDGRVSAFVRALLKKGAEAPRVIWFGRKLNHRQDGVTVVGRNFVNVTAGKRASLMPVKSLKVPGEHNQTNAMAAIAAALAMGIPVKTIAKAVRNFRGVPHRLEELGRKNGVLFVNDTAATTPDASIAALRAYSRRGRGLVLIAGGADKELNFTEWAKEVKKLVKSLVLFDGTALKKMSDALEAAGMHEYTVVTSMPDAITAAREAAKWGDIVLLSPACASFGIFTNEFDRGDKFAKEVRNLR
jgi:UDP-N-acetylmuramoylalanine--D-glutamate ligase